MTADLVAALVTAVNTAREARGERPVTVHDEACDYCASHLHTSDQHAGITRWDQRDLDEDPRIARAEYDRDFPEA